MKGRLFFAVNDRANGEELWQSDGTTQGTSLVAVIEPSPPFQTLLQDLTVFDGRLFFTADDGVHGLNLWVSDGTASGTVMVPGIRADEAANPGALTAIGNILLFIADDGMHGPEPWVIVAPALAVQGPGDGVPGQPRGFTFAVNDPIQALQSQPFTYTVDWGDGQ